MVQFSNRRLRRAEARRVEILRAAARIFRERGFAAAGMRDIAVAADLSPGNLYHYFRGKDELLYFCQDRTLDRLLAALEDASRGAGPIAGRLRSLAREHVLVLLDALQGSAAHFELAALPKRLRARIVAKRDRYERGVRALVAEGIRERSLAAPDATLATRAFLGALNWTAQWYRPDGPDSPQRVADVVAGFAAAGLEPERRPQGPRHSEGLRRSDPLRQSEDPRLRTENDADAHEHIDRPHRERRTDRGRVRAVQNAARGPA